MSLRFSSSNQTCGCVVKNIFLLVRNTLLRDPEDSVSVLSCKGWKRRRTRYVKHQKYSAGWMVKGQRAGKAVCNPAWSAGDPDVEVKGGQVGHFVAWVTPDCTWAEQTPTKNYEGAENWPFSHRLPNSALLGRDDSRTWSWRSGYVTWVNSECLSSKPAGNQQDSNLYNLIKVLFAKDSRMTSDSGEFHIWNYLYHRLSCCTRRVSAAQVSLTVGVLSLPRSLRNASQEREGMYHRGVEEGEGGSRGNTGGEQRGLLWDRKLLRPRPSLWVHI